MPGRGPLRNRALLALALVVPLMAGCQFLYPGLVPPVPGEEGFPNPSPSAEYTMGQASIAITGGDTIELGELNGDASLIPSVGANASWENDEGWYLRLVAPAAGTFGEPSFVIIDRITDGEHWTSGDPGRCVVDTDKVDKTGIKGRATCTGLQWHDALGGYFFGSGEQDPVPGQPKFDATITFEALPKVSSGS